MCVCSFPAVIASIFCHSLVCTLPVLSKHDKYFTQLKRYHSTDKHTGKHQIDNNKFHRKEWHSNDASSITELPLDYFGWNDFIAVLKQTVTNVSLFFLLRKHSFFFMGLSSFSVKWIDYCQIYLFRVFFNFLSRINRSIKGIKDLSSRYIICAMNCGYILKVLKIALRWKFGMHKQWKCFISDCEHIILRSIFSAISQKNYLLPRCCVEFIYLFIYFTIHFTHSIKNCLEVFNRIHETKDLIPYDELNVLTPNCIDKMNT